MPAILEEELLNRLHLHLSNQYARIYEDEGQKALICQIHSPYIPIEAFKSLFIESTTFIQQKGIRKFIFDKRNLRAFHQPSMEWYFVFWKQQMYHEWGLACHRKILPYEDWFKKCVEAGRHEIHQKYPDNVFHLLDIQYTNSLEEALTR